MQVSYPYGPAPQSFTYRMLAQPPIQAPKGTVRIVDSSSFHVSKTIAGVLQDIEPGGIREMHWHPNADEWQYYIEGSGRMTVFGAQGKARTFDYQAVWAMFPQTWATFLRIQEKRTRASCHYSKPLTLPKSPWLSGWQ
ncbi:hypothetical protein KSB_89430 [Ktedonobacter robiniae]|uniref:Cupin type-1 domain-containing protein n=1 Tax=Ktedonobacter robiniae TaxID=2778365 RepID=A0ABQ3V6C4_9CHLR|nr:hypothetical protein KSB_89430 [Ktedonobacter robiniae]